jgi:hypothetical protein
MSFKLKKIKNSYLIFYNCFNLQLSQRVFLTFNINKYYFFVNFALVKRFFSFLFDFKDSKNFYLKIIHLIIILNLFLFSLNRSNYVLFIFIFFYFRGILI